MSTTPVRVRVVFPDSSCTHDDAVDPNIIDNNGLKLSFGSYWNGMYQIGLWPDVKTQASVGLFHSCMPLLIQIVSQALPGTHLAGGNGRAAEGVFIYKPRSSQFYFCFFSAGITPLGGVSPFFASLLPTLTSLEGYSSTGR